MRPNTIVNLLCSFVLLASVAWSWPDYVEDVFKRADLLIRDASSTGTTQSAPASTGSAQSTGTDSATGTNSGTGTGTGTGTETGTETGTGTGTGTETGSAAKETGKSTGTKTDKTDTRTTATSVSVDPRLPAGGASLTNPVSTSTTYYKIGQNVTFGWNYTSLVNEPTAIDVIASCSSNKATYTLANNMSFSTSSVVWDTGSDNATATSPLLTAYYTLIIYEAGKSPSDVAGAGNLAAATYSFGMYLTQTPTPLGEYVCVTCNAAISDLERQALGFVFTMVTITIISFSIFAGGFGVFS